MLPRIAVVGSGIAGLSASYHLAGHAHITLFEANDYFGGHTHTVDVRVTSRHGESLHHGVDTGFLVLNERTYPELIQLLAQLGVRTSASDMSFSVQVPNVGLEWSGANLNTVFAQRRNLCKPAFWGMLKEVLRFNQQATELATAGTPPPLNQSIQDFLDQHAFSASFRDWYFLPMIGCIWSCPMDQMLKFPVTTLLRFCHNHGLIQVSGRPRWLTIPGGARQYVEKMLPRIPDARLCTPVRRISRLQNAQVMVSTDGGSELFDHVVLACHSDQSLALLADASDDERKILGAIRYHPNRAVLHTDSSVLPRRKRAWAAWNYERASDDSREKASVCLHYLINQLQPLPFETPVIVSLNPVRPPGEEFVQGVFDYAHPVFDAAAIAAQSQLERLQGRLQTWFCGAWTRYGFHEDGLLSGIKVADELRKRCKFSQTEAA
jgi:predicted NAD/FAD-binding protein